MSTISKAVECTLDDVVCQGDIYKDVHFNYIESEDDEGVNIIEYVFPYAIVVSQGCDVISMSKMECSKEGKATKFMPAILMCPIYDEQMARNTDHLDDAFEELRIKKIPENLYTSNEKKIVDKDWHYRFHALTIKYNQNNALEKSIIDFKQYFTVPISYLVRHREDRLFRLDDLYAEQITLKFSNYLSRVAMPD